MQQIIVPHWMHVWIGLQQPLSETIERLNQTQSKLKANARRLKIKQMSLGF
jgi:hypothetical protein